MQARAAGHLGPFDDSVAVLREHFTALRTQGRRREAGAARAPDENQRSPQEEATEEVAMMRIWFCSCSRLCATAQRRRGVVRQRGRRRRAGRRRLEDLRDVGRLQGAGAGARRRRLADRRHDSFALQRRRHARRCRDDREHDSRLRAADDDGAADREDAAVVPVQERLEDDVDGHHTRAGR